ncbi:MAG: hypothetical protein M3Q64_00190 [bacterium]|nr:hypothetical protein [bacterium]
MNKELDVYDEMELEEWHLRDWQILSPEQLNLKVRGDTTVRFLLVVMRNFFKNHLVAYHMIANRLVFNHVTNCKNRHSRSTNPLEAYKRCPHRECAIVLKGERVDVYVFYCELAAKFRSNKGLKLSPSVLTNYFQNGIPQVPDIPSRYESSKLPSLDDIERRIDFNGQYRGRYGKHY